METLTSANSLSLACAILAVAFFSGCSEDNGSATPAAEKNLSPAATNLVAPSQESAKDTLPHTVDTATEFPAAMDSLQAGAIKPDLRAIDVPGSNVVRVEKAPAIQKSSSTTQETKDIERDWDGTVLVPDGTQMSQAYTDDVKLTRIEAHPLSDGALRVWVRVRNLTDGPLKTRVACNFQSISREAMKTSFVPVTIDPQELVDVYFMSPMPNVVSYTILVR
ncbi:MAG: hypothetical protein AAFX93_07050 [Verrucomicrobiota bacterium]